MAHRVKKSASGTSSKGSRRNEKTEIILVYNIDSGVLKRLDDMLHRTLSPATTKCGLRVVTQRAVGTRRRWKAYMVGSEIPITVLYRDKFKEEYPKADAIYPAGFLKKGKKVEQFILSREIDGCKDVPCLEGLIEKKLRDRDRVPTKE